MASQACVSLSGVSLLRDGRAILADVDWTVQPGQPWVVLGPNGSGKTSLLGVASTYERASCGDVAVLGHRVGTVDVRQLRTRVGYASSALEQKVSPATTVGELIVTGKRAALMAWGEPYDDADHAHAATLATQMGVGGRLGQRVDRLSQGERRRAHIARALMGDPELLLLDEPTASLDLGGREELVGRLSELARVAGAPEESPAGGPQAIVLVTHHVEEIPPGFSHVALLRGGRLLADGPIGEVLTAEALSECFATPLTLQRRGGRFFAWRAC